MYDRLDKKTFSIVQKYEYDVKVSRTRTFVRGQRRTKVRPCGRTLSSSEYSKLEHLYVVHVYDVQKNPTWLEDVVLVHTHVLLYVYEAKKVVHVQMYEVK